MGFYFNNKHSDELGFCFKTRSMPYIPPKRQTSVEVQGRDGQYIFEDGYNNIEIELSCVLGDYEITERRKKARAIAAWLVGTGKLVFDYERIIEYKVVKVVNNIKASMDGYLDTFSITFECEPHPEQTFYNDELTWNEYIALNDINIPWQGYPKQFLNVVAGSTINVVNIGTYDALPIIHIFEPNSEDIHINDFTIEDMVSIHQIVIDCKNKVVYQIGNGDEKINRLNNFIGEFPILHPGNNYFTFQENVTGILFDYKNTYL